jgi:hypothetical protein
MRERGATDMMEHVGVGEKTEKQKKKKKGPSNECQMLVHMMLSIFDRPQQSKRTNENIYTMNNTTCNYSNILQISTGAEDTIHTDCLPIRVVVQARLQGRFDRAACCVSQGMG